MKKLEITISNELKNVEITVKNGKEFINSLLLGSYKCFNVEISEKDIKRVKKFTVKNADDKSSNKGRWYAHCNGYCMDIVVNYANKCTINTYFNYRKDTKI